MLGFAQWLSDTPLSLIIRKSTWYIPTIQIVHLVAITMIVTSAAMIAGRIFGFAGRTQTMRLTARRFLPWIWAALILLTPTGIVLIIAEPERTLGNPVFWLKMLLLAITIAVTAWFQASVRRDPALWEGGPKKFGRTTAFAASSIVLWLAILVAGRWIAYTY
jgi:uncharacterized membrane protein